MPITRFSDKEKSISVKTKPEICVSDNHAQETFFHDASRQTGVFNFRGLQACSINEPLSIVWNSGRLSNNDSIRCRF